MLRPKKNTEVCTNLTDRYFFIFFFFFADPAIFIAFQKKIKLFFIPTDPKMFQKKSDKRLWKCPECKINAKNHILLSFLDILNFIIRMFSGTVDDIEPQ